MAKGVAVFEDLGQRVGDLVAFAGHRAGLGACRVRNGPLSVAERRENPELARRTKDTQSLLHHTGNERQQVTQSGWFQDVLHLAVVGVERLASQALADTRLGDAFLTRQRHPTHEAEVGRVLPRGSP